MDIKFSMSEADVTPTETTANRIGRAMSGALREPGATPRSERDDMAR